MRLTLCAALLCCAGLRADEPILVFDPLPVPLRLPAGLTETLPLQKTASFYGDSIRVVDCEVDQRPPLGVCPNFLFGGHAMYASHLTGNITLTFSSPVNNITHFKVRHGVLQGDDATLAAPGGYSFPVLQNTVSDRDDLLSEGDLDLTTGGVTNIRYRVSLGNSALRAIVTANPKLAIPQLEFPGTRGRAWIHFEQRADGLLDFRFEGSTFNPLDANVSGDMFRWPMPFCDARMRCASVPARGSSLRPYLSLSTKDPGGDACASNCPEFPTNTIREFTVNGGKSAFGDDFDLDIPALGGSGPGRSQMQGRLQFQFGPRTGDTIPFIARSLPPAGLLADPPVNPILGVGFGPGLLGNNEFLRFPTQTYKLDKVVFVDEPFNIPHGMIDLRTGRVLGEFAWPAYFAQALAEQLFAQNSTKISLDPFDLIAREKGRAPGYALFERGTNGQTVFRMSAEHIRSFADYIFPSPDYNPAHSFLGGPKAELNLFARIQAMREAEPPRATRSGGATNVLSSFGDRFSYTFSASCDGKAVSFEYSNQNTGLSGGNFRLVRTAAVSCTSSRSSTAAAPYDIVTISGFGRWSKDADDAAPRFATAQFSTEPDAPYVSIFVFQNPDAERNVVLSNANTKPADRPVP